MSFMSWVRSCFSSRSKALSLYRSGMAKISGRDYGGAVADYTAAIEAADIPPDVKAMALYNRSLAYAAMGEDDRAAEDQAALVDLPSLPENIKTAVHQRRERLRRRDTSVDRA